MNLFRLVYHSRSDIDLSCGLLTVQVADILATSIVNNRKANITGGLIFDRAWFVQVLEGDRDAVIATYERIALDPRHHALVVAQSAHTDTRRFGDWWMAGMAWSKGSADFFLPILPEEGFDPRTLARDALIELVEAMVQHQARHRGRTWWTTRSALRTG